VIRRALLALAIVACSANDDIPAPQIASITPARASVGASIRIDGEYFCQQPEAEDPLACENPGNVSFGTLGATALTYIDHLIIVEVPSGIGLVQVTVAAGGRISNAVDFTIE
jgi:hypothetical protein